MRWVIIKEILGRIFVRVHPFDRKRQTFYVIWPWQPDGTKKLWRTIWCLKTSCISNCVQNKQLENVFLILAEKSNHLRINNRSLFCYFSSRLYQIMMLQKIDFEDHPPRWYWPWFFNENFKVKFLCFCEMTWIYFEGYLIIIFSTNKTIKKFLQNSHWYKITFC